MKGLRRSLQVWWTRRKKNECSSGKRRSKKNCKCQDHKTAPFWPSRWGTNYCLETDVIQGSLPGSRKRVRPKISWLNNNLQNGQDRNCSRKSTESRGNRTERRRMIGVGSDDRE